MPRKSRPGPQSRYDMQCARHAAHQAKYRRSLEDQKAPDREDFGRAALTIFLDILAKRPDTRGVDRLRARLIGELTSVGFAERRRFSNTSRE